MNYEILVTTVSNFPQTIRPKNQRFTSTITIDQWEFTAQGTTRNDAIASAIISASIIGGYDLYLEDPDTEKIKHPILEDFESIKKVAVFIFKALINTTWRKKP